MTNATKAVVIGLVNAGIQFVEAFGIYDFTDQQKTAITVLVNAALLGYVTLTYKDSPRRLPDSLEKVQVAGGGERLRVKV